MPLSIEEVNDESAAEKIPSPAVKLTTYGRARQRVRELEDRVIENLSKLGVGSEDEIRHAIGCFGAPDFQKVAGWLMPLSGVDRAKLIAQITQLKLAGRDFQRVKARAESELGRKQSVIDTWRAGVGRDAYNAQRRRVRELSNDELAAIPAEEKVERLRAQKADWKWAHARRQKGIPEAEIAAGLAAREAARVAKAEPPAQIAETAPPPAMEPNVEILDLHRQRRELLDEYDDATPARREAIEAELAELRPRFGMTSLGSLSDDDDDFSPAPLGDLAELEQMIAELDQEALAG